jgi:hypothetical protein
VAPQSHSVEGDACCPEVLDNRVQGGKHCGEGQRQERSDRRREGQAEEQEREERIRAVSHNPAGGVVYARATPADSPVLSLSHPTLSPSLTLHSIPPRFV